MTPSRRTSRFLALAATATLLVAGCGGGSDDDDPVVGGASPSASALASKGATGGKKAPGSASAPAGAATGKPGAAKGAPAPGGKPAAGSSGQKAGAPVTSNGQAMTAPGVYTYDNKGTVTAGQTRQVDGSAQLTVDKPVGSTQRSTLGSNEEGNTEQVVVRTATGTMLKQLKLNNAAFKKEFAPAKPVLAVPRPAKIGSRWSWTMTSTDGKTTAAFTGRITRNETIVIGGVKVATAVIESTLKLSGDITYTSQNTINYDETRLLQVKDRTRGDGMVMGFAFKTDITSVLRSTKPS